MRINWKNYSKLKSAGAVSFIKKTELVREAIEEIKDSDGNVTQEAEPKRESTSMILSQKCWDSCTGEEMPDKKEEYTLLRLEQEKAGLDASLILMKEKSDELAKAIADFKTVESE